MVFKGWRSRASDWGETEPTHIKLPLSLQAFDDGRNHFRTRPTRGPAIVYHAQKARLSYRLNDGIEIQGR